MRVTTLKTQNPHATDYSNPENIAAPSWLAWRQSHLSRPLPHCFVPGQHLLNTIG